MLKFRSGFCQKLLLGLIAIELGVASPGLTEGLSRDEDPGTAVEPSAAQGTSVHREAINIQGDVVAIDISLVGEELLEAKVTGFMKQNRPRLENVILVGPGVGRLAPTTRQVLRAGLEQDPPYPTKRSGLIAMNQGNEQLQQGTLIRELFQYQLPVEKMREQVRKKGGKANYEFWVMMSSANRGGDFKRYTFELEALPGLLTAEAK